MTKQVLLIKMVGFVAKEKLKIYSVCRTLRKMIGNNQLCFLLKSDRRQNIGNNLITSGVFKPIERKQCDVFYNKSFNHEY